MLRWAGIFVIASQLAAADHTEELYQSGDVAVFANELPTEVEFSVVAPAGTRITLQVDRNQNGKVDRDVDVAYSQQENGLPCFVYLYSEVQHLTSECGKFASAGRMRVSENNSSFTITIPKSELTTGLPVAHLSIAILTTRGKGWNYQYYPSEYFHNVIEFPFIIQ